MSNEYKALIVDDSVSLSFFNKVILERSGLFSSIEIRKNGKEALEAIKSNFTPDIIFLDINMPVMNGWQFLEEYSKLNNPKIPVMLLLGASLSMKDKRYLEKFSMIAGVRSKTLTAEAVLEIEESILNAKVL